MALRPLAFGSKCVRAQWLSCTSRTVDSLPRLPSERHQPCPPTLVQHRHRFSPHRHASTHAAPTASNAIRDTKASSQPPTSASVQHASAAPAAPAALRSPSPRADSNPPRHVTSPPSAAATSPTTLPTPDQVRAALQYCIDQVQRADPAAYLATLFAPATLRPALFTLRALWIEVSRIRQSTSDARIASMKLTWWSSTVKQLFAQPQLPPPSQPIVVMLHFLSQRHALTPRLFSRLIQAKLTDVEYAPPAGIGELDAYNEATYSSLLYLALQCVGAQPASVHADHVASHVGKATGLARMLQSLPASAREQRCYVPVAVMQQCKVDEAAVYRGEGGEGLREAVFQLASNAKAHIRHARTHISGLSKEQVSVMLDVVGVERWLDRLEEVNFDVFDPRLVDIERQGWEPLKLRWALWKHARAGTF